MGFCKVHMKVHMKVQYEPKKKGYKKFMTPNPNKTTGQALEETEIHDSLIAPKGHTLY